MKLRNKKTGEIGTLIVDGAYKFVTNFAVEDDEGNRLGEYNSLAELNEKWEDYEEPTTYYYISDFGAIREGDVGKIVEDEIARKEIGNYFETKEEAEKAVERLRAWKRLEDNGFRFDGWTIDDGLRISICTNTDSEGIYDDDKKEMKKDLNLFFGGEE